MGQTEIKSILLLTETIHAGALWFKLLVEICINLRKAEAKEVDYSSSVPLEQSVQYYIFFYKFFSAQAWFKTFLRNSLLAISLCSRRRHRCWTVALLTFPQSPNAVQHNSVLLRDKETQRQSGLRSLRFHTFTYLCTC